MAEEAIKIPIEIDPSNGLRGLAQFDANAQKMFNNFSKGSENATKSMAKIVPITGQANNALLNTGRIVQDLPFGFIAIANNINPAIESIQRLSAAAKAAGQSVTGALVKSLIGGGGLGFAVSIITSALSFAQIGMLFWSRGAKKMKTDGDDATKTILSLNDSLAQLGAQGAAQSVAALQKYRVALTDLQVPMGQRVKALQEYNQEADKANRLQENDLDNISKVNTAINNQIQLLERRALIRGAEQKMVELYRIVFESEFQLENAVRRANASQQQQQQLQTGTIEGFKASGAEVKKFTDDMFNLKKATDVLGAGKVLDLQFPADKAREQIRNLLNFIDEQIKKGVDFGGVFKGVEIKPQDLIIFRPGTIKTDLPTVEVPSLKIKVLSPQFNLEGNAKQLHDILFKTLSPEEVAKQYKSLIDQSTTFAASLKSQVGIKQLGDQIGANIGGITKETANAAIMVDQTLTPAFQTLFDAIEQGKSPVKAFFDSIVQSINQVIAKLIQAAIEAAIFSTIVPGGGSFGGNFLKFFGGSSSASGMGSIGGGGFGSTNKVVFEIAGNNLRGVLSAADAQAGRHF